MPRKVVPPGNPRTVSGRENCSSPEMYRPPQMGDAPSLNAFREEYREMTEETTHVTLYEEQNLRGVQARPTTSMLSSLPGPAQTRPIILIEQQETFFSVFRQQQVRQTHQLQDHLVNSSLAHSQEILSVGHRETFYSVIGQPCAHQAPYHRLPTEQEAVPSYVDEYLNSHMFASNNQYGPEMDPNLPPQAMHQLRQHECGRFVQCTCGHYHAPPARSISPNVATEWFSSPQQEETNQLGVGSDYDESLNDPLQLAALDDPFSSVPGLTGDGGPAMQPQQQSFQGAQHYPIDMIQPDNPQAISNYQHQIEHNMPAQFPNNNNLTEYLDLLKKRADVLEFEQVEVKWRQSAMKMEADREIARLEAEHANIVAEAVQVQERLRLQANLTASRESTTNDAHMPWNNMVHHQSIDQETVSPQSMHQQPRVQMLGDSDDDSSEEEEEEEEFLPGTLQAGWFSTPTTKSVETIDGLDFAADSEPIDLSANRSKAADMEIPKSPIKVASSSILSTSQPEVVNDTISLEIEVCTGDGNPSKNENQENGRPSESQAAWVDEDIKAEHRTVKPVDNSHAIEEARKDLDGSEAKKISNPKASATVSGTNVNTTPTTTNTVEPPQMRVTTFRYKGFCRVVPKNPDNATRLNRGNSAESDAKERTVEIILRHIGRTVEYVPEEAEESSEPTMENVAMSSTNTGESECTIDRTRIIIIDDVEPDREGPSSGQDAPKIETYIFQKRKSSGDPATACVSGEPAASKVRRPSLGRNSLDQSDDCIIVEDGPTTSSGTPENSTHDDGDDSDLMCCVCGAPATCTCSLCATVFYCSRECQRNDWSSHRSLCKILFAKRTEKQ